MAHPVSDAIMAGFGHISGAATNKPIVFSFDDFMMGYWELIEPTS
jgi:hypothetical protein